MDMLYLAMLIMMWALAIACVLGLVWAFIEFYKYIKPKKNLYYR